jgi:hypothetical protein
MKNNYALRKVCIKLLVTIALLVALFLMPFEKNVTASAKSLYYQIKNNGYVYKNAHIKAIKSRSAKRYFGSHKLMVKKTTVVKRHGKKLVYKYVLASNGRNGWVNTKYVKRLKAAKHKYVPKKHKKTIKKSVTINIPNTNKKVSNKTKPKSKVNAPVSKKDVQYVPNKENIKNEFKKLLDPYLVKYGKTYGIPKDYGTPAGKLIVPIADSNGYGDEFAITFGTAVRSDKEMAKTLFNSLLNGTLMSYLEDHSDVSVIVDHIDIDPSDGIIEAKLYLTWYQDRNITPKFAIVNGTPTYFY